MLKYGCPVVHLKPAVVKGGGVGDVNKARIHGIDVGLRESELRARYKCRIDITPFSEYQYPGLPLPAYRAISWIRLPVIRQESHQPLYISCVHNQIFIFG